jgi:hypothetical protein
VYKLFYGDENEALRSAIESGKGYKATAAYLWPSLKPETAYARIKACVNEDKAEKFAFSEIIALCNFNGRFDPLMYACDETHHDRPQERAPADKHAQLMQQFIQTGEQMKRIADQIERLGAKP